MDQETTARLDALTEDELQRGFRVKKVPLALQAELKAAKLPGLTAVRFTRINPRRKAKIAEAVQRRYHKDLQNPDILSNDQIAKLVESRGEWTTEQGARMLALMDETQALQAELYLEGLQDATWETDLMDAAAAVSDAVATADYTDADEQRQVQAVLRRWVDYLPAHLATYTTLYAAEQGTEQYSSDKDLLWLSERMPSQEAADTLQTLDDLRHKAIKFLALQEKRRELAVLQSKHARIFADSVESRRDQSEEMARVYYCTEQVNELEDPTGPLCPTLDALWDLPENVIRWLIIEYYFFVNGLTDEARDYLTTFGFMNADREESDSTTSANGDSAPSVESPDPLNSRDGMAPRVAMAAGSSA